MKNKCDVDPFSATRMWRLGLVAIIGVSMCACGSGSQKWKEEVLLSDGRIVVVDRETLNERGGGEWASNRGGFKPKEYRIRFTHPVGSGEVIEWRSEKVSPQTWPEIPLIYDMHIGKPAIYTLLAISPGCEVYSRYVYKNNAWSEDQLPEKLEVRATNLLFGSVEGMPELLSLGEKRTRNSDGGYRRALMQVGPARKVCGY